MNPEELDRAASTDELAAALERYQDDLHSLHDTHDMHGHPNSTVREVTHEGHVIRIVTTYEIEVDGLPITGHLLVTNEGTVHYHAIPNQEFSSAVDVVKRIIDLAPPGAFSPPSPGHGGHDGAHGHPGGG